MVGLFRLKRWNSKVIVDPAMNGLDDLRGDYRFRNLGVCCTETW